MCLQDASLPDVACIFRSNASICPVRPFSKALQQLLGLPENRQTLDTRGGGGVVMHRISPIVRSELSY